MTETAETAAPVNWSKGETPLLELRGVNKSFGGLVAVGDLDLQVNQGEIVSIIGPNGAGKTTVFNLITGLYKPNDVLAGKSFWASFGLIFRRLGLVLAKSPMGFLRWLLSVVLGVVLGYFFITKFLNVIIYSAVQDGHLDLVDPTVKGLVIVWTIFWPLFQFWTFYRSPSNGFWAELD